METYIVLTYVNEKIVSAFKFESPIQDLDKKPYSDECPIVVGSNQRIVNYSDEQIVEAECAFCGHHGVCRVYFKVDFIDQDIMDALGEDGTPMGRYGNPFCIDTCYKKIDRLMHTKFGCF